MINKGYVHVYTGDGKGKTTAALGLAIRAAGAGLKVYIGQFMKQGTCSELKSLKKFKYSIIVEQFGGKCLLRRKGSSKDRLLAQKGLNKVKKIIAGGECDLVILDELIVALYFELLDENEVTKLIKSKPKGLELVLTGRKASRKIKALADIVTEMKELKHYYKAGVKERIGIEK